MRLQCKEGGRWGRKEGGRRKERGEGEGVTERRMRGETTTNHYLLGFSPLPLLLPIILIGLYNPSYNPSYNPIIPGSWVQSSYEACPMLPGWSSSCPRPELRGSLRALCCLHRCPASPWATPDTRGHQQPPHPTHLCSQHPGSCVHPFRILL